MSYLTDAQANRPAAIAGVIAIHAGLAAVLLAGLTVANVVQQPPGHIETYNVKQTSPPEEPPKKQPESAEHAAPISAPQPPIDLVTAQPIDLVVNELPEIIETAPLTLPRLDMGTGKFEKIDPVRAIPANDPGRWVTDADYRSRWIREGRYGTASFRLEIGPNGKVSNCAITRSSGHEVLDQATCKLIGKRARFQPAKDASGAKVSGTYESSIRWVLPD